MSGRQNIETIVGLGVMALCMLLLLIVYKDGLLGSSKTYYTLNTTFERADGINLGSDVSISGVKIGEVKQKRIDPNNYNAIITITIEKGLKLPIDTSAEITSASLLGDKYISIVPGAEKDILKDGDTIEFTQSSINIEGLITKFFFGLDAPKGDSGQEAPSS
jgi:phospholipid/cholesterol/gamma-HCH transport system substrate-binding protein